MGFRKLVRNESILTFAIIIMIAVALFGLSIGTPSLLTVDQPEYPFEYGANFMNACIENGGTASGCLCSLKYMEKHYTYNQAQEIDDQVTTMGELPNELQQVFVDCQKDNTST